MKPSARRKAREYALQALYQWHISQASITDIEAEFLIYQIKQKPDFEYFKELLHEIPKNFPELDEAIHPFLKRALTELDPIELTILRIATYELTHRLDVPYRVVINEALELEKKFGSSEGYKFVNGVLDQVAKKIRAEEIKAFKNE